MAKRRAGNAALEEHKPAASAARSSPVLPWMRVPITIKEGSGTPLDEVGGLNAGLKKVMLSELHYPELFPVQSVVWRELAGGMSAAHDLCIAAPTGSGKTLAYALPVINSLARRRGSDGGGVHCLQALIVLPTRDLAAQVHSLFATLCSAAGLVVTLAAARATQEAEAAQLVGPDGSESGGADVVVATPGRLMAHLQSTAGFTLRHLRFLVVDETDRLLRQSYQGWLPGVQAAVAWHRCCRERDTGTGLGSTTSSLMPYAQDRTVKLVVSATLPRDPSKLARLGLHWPRYVAASAEDHRYHLPRSLSEHRILCSAARKPLVLLALLGTELEGQSTLVFTSSLDMTHKLFLMLEAAGAAAEGAVVEFSSVLPPAQRAHNLQMFKSGQARVLVASDAMTRGMDVEGVQNVVNYDAPVYVKTYVHRAGRTARAGRAGRVFTLLRDEDMRHFKAMLRKADNNYVKEYHLPSAAVEAMQPRLDNALQQVQALMEAERHQASQPAALPASAAAAPRIKMAKTAVIGLVGGHTGNPDQPQSLQQQHHEESAERPPEAVPSASGRDKADERGHGRSKGKRKSRGEEQAAIPCHQDDVLAGGNGNHPLVASCVRQKSGAKMKKRNTAAVST